MYKLILLLIISLNLYSKNIEGKLKENIDYDYSYKYESYFPFNLYIKYKFESIIGEPLVKAIAKYYVKIGDYTYFQYKNKLYNTKKYYSNLDKAKIIDLWVEFKLNFKYPLDYQNLEFINLPTTAYVNVSMGAMNSQGKWSFNTPTSYGWNEFLYDIKGSGEKVYYGKETAKKAYKYLDSIEFSKISKLQYSFIDFKLKDDIKIEDELSDNLFENNVIIKNISKKEGYYKYEVYNNDNLINTIDMGKNKLIVNNKTGLGLVIPSYSVFYEGRAVYDILNNKYIIPLNPNLIIKEYKDNEFFVQEKYEKNNYLHYKYYILNEKNKAVSKIIYSKSKNYSIKNNDILYLKEYLKSRGHCDNHEVLYRYVKYNIYTGDIIEDYSKWKKEFELCLY